MLSDFGSDLRQSARGLRHTSVFAAAAILCPALGIGAVTAVFSLLNGLWLRPLPYRDAGRLIDIYEHHPIEVCAGCRVGTSYAACEDLRVEASTVSELAAHRTEVVTPGLLAGAEQRRAARTTASLFPLLDGTPLYGRAFTAAEKVADDAVVVLSERLWRSRFDADPRVVGRTVRVNGELRTPPGRIDVEA